jgi:hypothetical protein
VLSHLQQKSSLRRTRLYYCDVNSATGELGMTIIMLGGLYFLLSCRLASNDAAFVQHERHAGNGATNALTESHPSSGVDFWCEDTCHAMNLNPRSEDLVCGLSLASINRACSRLRYGSCPGPGSLPWADYDRAT